MAYALEQSHYLGVLCRCPADAVKRLAEEILPLLGPVEVLQNRTGLVMVPMVDTAQGASFYLGEALLAEAHVRLASAEGYAACLGRDLEQALAIALVDAAVTAGIAHTPISSFIHAQSEALTAEDEQLMRAVAATRVEMETF
jgi:alpha-D-ribose 1-methylphosphonate 5-triphosphate synthase subunit PhnG